MVPPQGGSSPALPHGPLRRGPPAHDFKKLGKEARQIFEDADKDGNLLLTKGEVKAHLQADRTLLEKLLHHKIPWQDVFTELEIFDTDGDGHMSEEEFVQAVHPILHSL